MYIRFWHVKINFFFAPYTKNNRNPNNRISVILVRVTGLEPARGCHQNLNLARLPIPPHPHILLCHSTVVLRKELFVKDSCGAQNFFCSLLTRRNFDRYAISPLLHPPQAACGLNATNSATPAY